MTGIAQHPFWWEEAEPQDTELQPLPNRVDVAIVGGGYAGLGAAIPLARAGRSVLVLERDRPGDGASSRNGGITSGNLRWSFSRLVSAYGMERAKTLYIEGAEARRDLYNFIQTENIDCDYQPSGRFTGAMTPEAFDGMRREADIVQRHTEIPVEVVQPENQKDEIGSDLYHGGLIRPDIGGVHPGKLHREMLRIAEAAGAVIHGRTPVTDISRTGAAFTVTTRRGTVTADSVIVATNGYSDAGVPGLRRRVVPVVSEMIATAPLAPDEMDGLVPKRRMLSETREIGYYFRPSPDGTRILLGGRRYHNDTDIARERLRQGLLSIFPSLANTPVTHHWHGFVAFPMDQLPKIAVLDGIIYAAGFCGSGVVWARWMGQQAAAMVTGRDSPSAFDGIPFRPIPLYDGRPWFLPAMMAYYRFRDWLRERGA